MSHEPFWRTSQTLEHSTLVGTIVMMKNIDRIVLASIAVCVVVASFWTTLTLTSSKTEPFLKMTHAFSPTINGNHHHSRRRLNSQVRHQSNVPFPSAVVQPEIISTHTAHKYKYKKQSRTRPVKAKPFSASAALLDLDQVVLQVTTELQQRIEDGFRYQHHNHNDVHQDCSMIDESDFELCQAVFIGYRFTIEERERLRSAHVVDSLAP